MLRKNKVAYMYVIQEMLNKFSKFMKIKCCQISLFKKKKNYAVGYVNSLKDLPPYVDCPGLNIY